MDKTLGKKYLTHRQEKWLKRAEELTASNAAPVSTVVCITFKLAAHVLHDWNVDSHNIYTYRALIRKTFDSTTINKYIVDRVDGSPTQLSAITFFTVKTPREISHSTLFTSSMAFKKSGKEHYQRIKKSTRRYMLHIRVYLQHTDNIAISCEKLKKVFLDIMRVDGNLTFHVDARVGYPAYIKANETPWSSKNLTHCLLVATSTIVSAYIGFIIYVLFLTSIYAFVIDVAAQGVRLYPEIVIPYITRRGVISVVRLALTLLLIFIGLLQPQAAALFFGSIFISSLTVVVFKWSVILCIALLTVFRRFYKKIRFTPLDACIFNLFLILVLFMWSVTNLMAFLLIIDCFNILIYFLAINGMSAQVSSKLISSRASTKIYGVSIFFWTSYISTVIFFLFMFSVFMLCFSINFFSINYIIGSFAQFFISNGQLGIFIACFLFNVFFFIKVGVAPFFLWKCAFMKSLSRATFIVYLLFYYTHLVFFYLFLIFFHLSALAVPMCVSLLVALLFSLITVVFSTDQLDNLYVYLVYSSFFNVVLLLFAVIGFSLSTLLFI